MIGFGARSGMGLYLDPMTVELGWSRETYALAMALQNIMWGIGLPVAGAIVDFTNEKPYIYINIARKLI